MVGDARGSACGRRKSAAGFRSCRPTGVSFAPLGRLVVVDDGERVVCHLCGRALAMLGASHLRQHGWTAAEYREEFGLRRGAALNESVPQEH